MMMKKLIKLALLAVTTAFMLAGFPACLSYEDPILIEIEINVDESKRAAEYTVGEDFNPADITVVTARYSDGSKKDVTADAEFNATCNGNQFTTEKVGTFAAVTLSATYGGKIASISYTIKVKAAD